MRKTWGDESPPTEYEKWKGKAKKKRGLRGEEDKRKRREEREEREERKKPKWKVCVGREKRKSE